MKPAFNHVAIGQTTSHFHNIRTDASVNAVVQSGAMAKPLEKYLQSLTLLDLKLSERYDTAYTYALVDGGIDFSKASDEAFMAERLKEGFPQRSGFDALVHDVMNCCKAFAEATGYDNLSAFFMVSVPQEAGCWHHDNDTDVRGFKAYLGDGPLIRANETVTQKCSSDQNFYGRPDVNAILEVTVDQIREGDFGIWKGDVHSNPLIHVKPNVLQEQFRLSLMINHLQDDYLSMLKKKGWARFYRPDFN